ncbi:hypothetical protein SAMD00019534_016760 [Acytostelium subglobosum LB1]|uniref:hypothetical protein n=1 Tax=Acytostelium subglobosum LB1 TaxID=1410327 RepID=UPI000644EDBA|nr:hypothetical protein SAMD00019534_016760 [Acytostelium subglobosum LB1]GAM18501.1 hypothetical protein SAMD00019534_016760 [Acytostelium subglobosum LB1]|eukprot:XP_012757721.1 hypothetical protein SAMD00019534_016760 [Acytostelium subglobosum LB1]
MESRYSKSAVDRSNRFARKTGRKHLVSKNPYLSLLVKLDIYNKRYTDTNNNNNNNKQLYTFLARRTGSKFNKIVLKRLVQTRTNKVAVSISRIANAMKDRKAGKIAVIVGPVVNDERLLDVPNMTVVALKFSESVRARIVKAGGRALTFDQFALIRPRGNNTFLLKGVTKARTVYKHFGRAPGLPGSTARPYVRSAGNKFERARTFSN